MLCLIVEMQRGGRGRLVSHELYLSKRGNIISHLLPLESDCTVALRGLNNIIYIYKLNKLTTVMQILQ